MSEKIKVGLVEDQLLFRQGMKAILSAWSNIDVMFESPDGFSVIAKLKQMPVVPDVMLVDFSLPPNDNTEFTGKDVTVALREQFSEMKVIILSVHDDENFIAQAIEHGAHGYLVKDSNPEEVYQAICGVYNKGSYINERALKALQKNLPKKHVTRTPAENTPLTKREEDILQLVCQQLTAEEIAEKLFISVKTVNGHRAHLLEKTGAKNVAGLVIYAVKNQIIKI